MSLSQNVKRCRKASGISQEYMGDQLNINQSAYSRLEGRDDVCDERLVQIASALDTTPDELRTYHTTHDLSLMESDVALSVVPVGKLLQQKEEMIQTQAEEITFLRRQIIHLQAVWHQYCGGGEKPPTRPLRKYTEPHGQSRTVGESVDQNPRSYFIEHPKATPVR